MPGRHWIIAKNLLTNDYQILPWWDDLFYPNADTWMSKYYCASEMREPQWKQIGIYESEGEAQDALGRILQS